MENLEQIAKEVAELKRRERESDTSVDGGEGNEKKKRLNR